MFLVDCASCGTLILYNSVPPILYQFTEPWSLKKSFSFTQTGKGSHNVFLSGKHKDVSP